jgi:hypothetical protein
MTIDLKALTKPYKHRNPYTAALQYDGSQEMAEAIEERCEKSYCLWDEAGLFCGLRAMPYYAVDEGQLDYVGEGDYLVWDGHAYSLYDKRDFESKFV